MISIYRIYNKLGLISYYASTPLRWLLISKRVRSYVVIEYDSRMIIVQNWLGKGEWSFPGGGAKKNETALQAAVREVHEELGIKLEPGSLSFLREGYKKDGISGKHYALFHIQLNHQPSLNVNRFELADVRWEPVTSLTQLQLCYESLQALDAIRPID